MKLLLRKNVSRLGIVGDIIEVANGYARNYLLPQGLATEPTEANMRALADARKAAEEEQAQQRAALQAASDKIHSTEVTVAARANAEGVLYGSVGKREIAEALVAEGHTDVTPDAVILKDPLRRLDNVLVQVKLAEGIEAEVKVWVVRDKTASDDDDNEDTYDEEDAGVEEQTADGERAE